MSEVRSIGVLGAGVMGGGIAQVCAIAGFEVVCYDIDPSALEAGKQHAVGGRYGIDAAVERGKLTRDEADAAITRLAFVDSFEEAAGTDLIVEAVPERLALKIQVFRDLDRVAPAETVLCSNSSGFPIQALAAATDRPERVIGWHWASPAPVMKLAELVRTRMTSDDTVETVSSVALRCGKNPVVVNDTAQSWGFVANRVYFAMIREADRVVAEGIATRDQVDQIMTDCFRWPSGPYGMVKGATEGWKQ
ncbi:MAG TPA: 3-hydroxyacyl-CoA dehydrogenase family protein [Acidimicrobiia bacterium]|jgi:3-hydroxyacyl-CoA dehydrogenase